MLTLYILTVISNNHLLETNLFSKNKTYVWELNRIFFTFHSEATSWIGCLRTTEPFYRLSGKVNDQKCSKPIQLWIFSMHWNRFLFNRKLFKRLIDFSIHNLRWKLSINSHNHIFHIVKNSMQFQNCKFIGSWLNNSMI